MTEVLVNFRELTCTLLCQTSPSNSWWRVCWRKGSHLSFQERIL